MKQALFLFLILAALLAMAATTAFYVIDNDGDRLPFGTSGTIKFPNITGTANNIEVIFDHADLINKGTATHAQIDSHVTDSSVHFIESSISHQNLIGAGTNTHTQIDSQLSSLNSHAADPDIHFELTDILHDALTGAAGYRNHSAIDAQAEDLDAHLSDSSIHAPIYDNVSTTGATLWSSEYTKNYVDITGGGFVLSVTDNTTTVSPVNSLTFNPDTGFSVVDTGSGTARIDMGSTFNPIQVSGQSDLDSSGEEPLRFVAGSGISLTTNPSSTPKSLTITATGGGSGGLVVDTDTTCYVATTGSDTTGDGSSGSPYATPHKCLDHYAGHKINSDVWLTIQFSDGIHTIPSKIEITHPNGDRIAFEGAHTYTKTLQSITSTSGTAGNYSVTVSLDNADNLVTNDFVIIRDPSGGVNPLFLAGFWKVTGVSGTQITLNSKHRYGVPSGSVIGTVIVLKSIIDIPDGMSGFWLDNGNRVGKIDKLAMVGNNLEAAAGIIINRGLYVTAGAVANIGPDVGTTGLNSGFNAEMGGTIVMQHAVSSGNKLGIYTVGGIVNAQYAIVSGNTFSGFYNNYNGLIMSRYGKNTGNLTGIISSEGSVSSIDYGWLSSNGTNCNALSYSVISAGAMQLGGC